MLQIINSNPLSPPAQRSLNASQGALQSAAQRLSSGLRINGSADNPADLAISERFNAQIGGLNQAARNVQDAISLSQVGDGSLASIASNLQRMRELAVQAANGSQSQSERDSLNQEFDQLRQENNRIAAQTSFAGVRLLDGSLDSVSFQIGPNDGEALVVSMPGNMTASAVGAYAAATVTGTAASAFTAIAAGDLTLDGPASASGVSLGEIGPAANAAERAAQIRTAVNAVAGQTGVYAEAGNGETVSLRSSGAFTVGFAGASASQTSTGLQASTTSASPQAGYAGANLLTSAGAGEAMMAIDAALTVVAERRAAAGASQSRLGAAVDSLQAASANIAASRSGVMDADFAQESARLARAQILRDAGNAMLVQANASAEQVVSLLRSR
jgi:flagellin